VLIPGRYMELESAIKPDTTDYIGYKTPSPGSAKSVDGTRHADKNTSAIFAISAVSS
jgi:hypothetical protein